jgi:hypothetical protein
MTWLLGLAMVLLSGHVLANAKVFSMTGTVSAATGPAPAQPVKVGDTIRAGQTAITGANSTVVLQFPDGQLAALTPNSRMTIEQYQFNEQAKTGNVLLALISGGMRAVTGLIGRSSPEKVSYKAATATIGIRGTDTTIAIQGTQVVILVTGGQISFSYTNPSTGVVTTQNVAAGNGIAVNPTTGAVTISSVTAIVAALGTTTPIAAAVSTALSTGFTATVTSAATGSTAQVVVPAPPQTTSDAPVTIPPPPPSP